jgi:hypothetical protein
MMTIRQTLAIGTVVMGAFAAALLGIPWWLGWRNGQYWTTTGALAATASALFTLGAAIAAFVYVELTRRLWQEAAAEREGGLMLTLINGYDQLRDDIEWILQYYIECATSGPVDPVERYRTEMGNVDFVADRDARDLDDHRFRVSRFFVRTRKLVRAGFLSERVVVAALERQAIEDVFLRLIDPLDKAKAGKNYDSEDHRFYTSLLSHYSSPKGRRT